MSELEQTFAAGNGPVVRCCGPMLVGAKHLSNCKQIAGNHQKCGNAYLNWAFVKAANSSRLY